MAYCNKCGAKILKGAKVCPECKSKIGLVVHPLSLHKTGKVFAISLIISIAIVLITVVVGVFALGSTDTANKIFYMQIGWPLGWFQMSRLTLDGSFSIGISNWANLIGNFIFYLLLCFVLAYTGEMFYSSIKRKNK